MSDRLGLRASQRKPKNPQLVPFLVLVGVVGAFGVLFFQVIRPLILPLFLAAVIAMLAHPLQVWMTAKLRGRGYIAAGIVTVLIVLIVLGPLGTGVYLGFRELTHMVISLQERISTGDLQPLFDPETNPDLAAAIAWVNQYAPVDVDQVREGVIRVASGAGQNMYRRTLDLLGDLAGFVVGLVMFLIALYFFLVDGPKIVEGWENLTPLDSEHDRILRTEFSKVCRGVVWATLAAAVGQAFLFGMGLSIIEFFADAGVGRWIFLLCLVTTITAMIPFFGAAAVWIPTGLFYLSTGHWAAGTAMLLYGGLVVSTADNFIKVMVIKESASMHPLLVFVCVFGGIRLVGILGIFIGPIVGAVLFALMRILKKELLRFSQAAVETAPAPAPTLRWPMPFRAAGSLRRLRRRKS